MSRKLSQLCAALLLAVPLTVLSGAGAAVAADGLSYRSTTTYTIDAQSGVVHVAVEVTLTNTVADRRDGNTINRRYFTGFSLPAPTGASNEVATTSGGTALASSTRILSGNDTFVIYDIDFADNLFYKQTAYVLVTYDILGLPPRSDNPSRVNGAYASFEAFGVGDDGKVTVRVVVPPGFETDTFGDEATVAQENGSTVYTATDIPNPKQFSIFVSARNDDELVQAAVSTPDGDQFTVRAWPADTDWQTFVTTQIQDGVPVLSELIGQQWPIDETVDVREAYTPYLYGYAGWFSAADNEIEIGEDLDAEVVLHELSHAWFNATWFTDRWLSEGFAQVYASKSVEELGGSALAPNPISNTDAGMVTLNEWGDPNFVAGADEVEDYGYNASFSVVQQIVAEIGEEKMRDVLSAVADRTIAYRGEGKPEDVGVAAGWRRFLDLVEEVGGGQEAASLIEQYVITPAEKVELETRTKTRTAYAELVAGSGDWSPPFALRQQMSSWSFVAALATLDDAHEVLDLRDELDIKAGELGTGYPDDFESMYEAASTMLDDTKTAVQQQIDTADAVLAAVSAEAADDGLFGRVGLMGTRLPGVLEEAKAAFAVGDHELAREKAQEVLDTVEKAPAVGKTRSLIVGGAALSLLLVVALVLLLLRRRRAAIAAAETASPEAESADPADDGSVVDGSTSADDFRSPTDPV